MDCNEGKEHGTSVNLLDKAMMEGKPSIWCDLPHDILKLIVNRLNSVVCSAGFRSVCRSWRSFFLQYCSDRLPPPPPWIMMPNGDDLKNKEELSPTLCCVYGLDGKNVCQTTILEASERRYIGSSGIWLIFLDPERMLGMVNPLSQVSIRVTSKVKKAANTSESEEEELIEQFNKVSLSSPGPLIMKNNVQDVIAAAIYDSYKLGFIRPGDKWTSIEIECSHPQPPTAFHDIICHQQKLYAVNNSGEIFVCDIDAADDPPKAIKLELPKSMIEFYTSWCRSYFTHVYGCDRCFLVEVSGDLILVLRFFCGPFKSRKTYHFKVFKLDFTSMKWDLVTSLGDHSLFLGKNALVSLLASDSSKFMKDHIYFIDSFTEETETLRYNRMAEYSIESGFSQSRYRGVYHHLYPPFLWIIPRHIAYRTKLRKRSFHHSLYQVI